YSMKVRANLMRKDCIYEYILSRSKEYGGNAESFEITAQEVAEALGIWRNDSSVDLNKLVAEGKLCRSGKKNVRYFLAAQESGNCREKNVSGTPDTSLNDNDPEEREVSAFSRLVGANGSLKYQIHMAKAAASYPSHGLNMLITGPTGAGKTMFAHVIWEYTKEINAFSSKDGHIPFVHFNCAEYAENPQLLMMNLFGYKKGAYTGAFEDKAGLVEEADGGILLLDEIHCLASTGQELFFTLLDTGYFRRIGDNVMRESHFMLIGATTKPVTDVLLDTFLRRMPVLIQLPSLAERPLKERHKFIERFYAEEANRIGHPLRIKKDVLNALLDYTFHANLGNLKNVIQISCAKGYLKNTSEGMKNDEITISFSDLSFQALSSEDHSTEKNVYSSARFSADMYVSTQKSAPSDTRVPSFVDIYDFVEKRMDMGRQEGLGTDALQQMIALEVDNYYKDLDKSLSESGTDMELLNSIVFPGSIPISAEFLGMASKELHKTYSPTAPLLLAMHISQYVDRMRSELPVFPADFRNIVKGCIKEVIFLQKTRAWLSSVLKIKITDDELDFLAIFLSQASEKQQNPGIWITLVSYNTSTASSIGEFANSVFFSRHIHWVDGKSIDSMHKMFENVCGSIKMFHGENGNLIFTDIDVLSSLEYEISKATDVKCRVIPSLEQHLLMDACKITLASNCELDEAYERIIRNYSEYMLRFFESSRVDDLPVSGALKSMPFDKIVITVCVTGVGSAQSIKEILESKLSYIPDLTILSMSSLEDIKGKALEYGPALKLIVGTVNPNIPDVPFLPADRIFTASGMYCISTILEDWNYNIYSADFEAGKPIGDELEYILNDVFSFIAPSVDKKTAVACISKMMRTLEADVYKKPLPDEVKARVFMHAASMLERIANNKALEMEEEAEETIKKNETWFHLLEKIIKNSFVSCGYDIPRDENYYFMLSLPEV
ncbi:MAG TPA: sigma 54-interacting transcriptional regulator, partial [Anaerovoracaceae bacterium]|nr:sigma 54-interacting transcriptional regulator [Anaerovoracaceae bacterium]